MSVGEKSGQARGPSQDRGKRTEDDKKPNTNIWEKKLRKSHGGGGTGVAGGGGVPDTSRAGIDNRVRWKACL